MRQAPGVSRRGRAASLGAVAGLLLAVASCGPAATQHPKLPVITVTEKDFRLQLSPAQVQAGWVTLDVSNAGPDTHEVLIVRGTGPDGGLALRPDGVTVDEDALESQTVGTVDDLQPRSHRTLRLRLDAGRYELFCNMAGHYLTGMHSELTVAPTA
jgi:uncharacterized cupredoxin-like copper-binding protein